MTRDEAVSVIQVLNAGFPRDAIEAETIALWVRDLEGLASYAAAQETARVILWNGDRFPMLKEFRGTYRQTLDRLNTGRVLEEPFEAVPPPPEAKHLLDVMRTGSILKDMPE